MRSKAERATHGGTEHRAYPVRLEVRAAGSEQARIEGYASVTEAPYEMYDFLGSYTEVVRSGAFAKTLTENPQVQLLLNHGGLSMAYTRAGTLRLSEDSTGLHIAADLNTTRSDVRDMVSALADGNVDEMSFAFRVPAGKSQWSPDYDQRDIVEVDIHRGDVSVVNFGANPATTAAVRAQDLDQMDEAAARELYERLGRRLAPQSQPSRALELYVAEIALLG
ncbi:HK97 family phage prohead protease [Salinispora cortesiana]|uniref:HK97 family phage prohead protease n=1 Tax=Salinispora cortesiana TaxID=1305843 RepID=UPI00041B285E|nr:HK97 family phage prohead protease [Salinispora cortesiana]